MLADYVFWGSSLVFAITTIFFALFIVLRDPKSLISITSFILFLFSFIWILSGILLNMEVKNFFNSGNVKYILYIYLFTGNLLPALLLIWSHSFPQKSKLFNIKNIILLIVIWIPSSLSITIFLSGFIIANEYSRDALLYVFNEPHISLIYPVVLDFLAVLMFVINQLHYYKKYSNDREKGKIRFFLTGFSFAILFNVASPFLTYLLEIDMLNYIGYLGIVICILFSSYSILKFRTLDFKMFINRFLKAIVTSLILALPVVVVTNIYINSNLKAIHSIPKFILISVGVFIYYFYVILVMPLLNKRFDRKTLDSETTLKSLFENIVGVKSLKNLATIIIDGLRNTIYINEYSFYVISNNPLSFNLLLSKESSTQKNKLFLPKKLSELMIEYDTVIESNDINKYYSNKPLVNFLDMYFNFFDCKLIVPIVYGDNVIAIINIKNKIDDQPIYSSDIDLINNLRQGIAVGIMNAMLYDDLIKEREKLEDRVKARTSDLTMANMKLSETLQELENKHKELQEAQMYILQSEKMTYLGELVAEISHEVNSPLGTIQSSADILNRLIDRLNSQEKNEKNINDAIEFLEKLGKTNIEAVEKISSVFMALKQFSKLDEAKFKTVNIEKELDYVISLVSYKTQDRIEIHKDYGNVPEIDCYASELNQVFMNILRNSIESIEKTGDIYIKTYQKNNMIYIIIKDTGKGIPKEEIPKVFTPSFTTKGAIFGTGAGLFVSYNIIKKHNGDIVFESDVGKGTTITLSISMNTKG